MTLSSRVHRFVAFAYFTYYFSSYIAHIYFVCSFVLNSKAPRRVRARARAARMENFQQFHVGAYVVQADRAFSIG